MLISEMKVLERTKMTESKCQRNVAVSFQFSFLLGF